VFATGINGSHMTADLDSVYMNNNGKKIVTKIVTGQNETVKFY